MGFLIVLIGAFSVIIQIARSQDQQGFISLDCGLSLEGSPYIEPRSGLTFTSDAPFIQTGESGRVEKNFDSIFRRPYLVLRYFREGTRNCYNLNVTRGMNYLIRATFLYGNYDGLNSYPSFDLYLGPNKWATIDLGGEVNGTREELIHLPRSNVLDVCFVKTGTTTPFVSTLELRPLENDTYLTQSGSLRNSFRIYSTNSSNLIRYPDDARDRLWTPFFSTMWTPITTTLDVDNSNIYQIPKSILKTGATPTNASGPLTLTWTVDPPDAKVYFYLHFAEIQSLRANDTREFNILINGNVIRPAFSPRRFAVYTLYTASPEECDRGECILQLVRTQNSTLPPLINAVEAYYTIEFPQLETNPSDVFGIKDIKATYGLKKISWQGDPCVPHLFSWENLKCNYTDMSRPLTIVSLNLSSSGLNGNIAPSIENLTQLQELDLSNNNLTGEVPIFLANMGSLLVIKLNGNNLDGSIPQALLDRQKNGLELHVDGNPELCKSSSCGNDKKKLVPIIASVASAVVIVVVLVIVFVLKKKKHSTGPTTNVTDDRTNISPEPSILRKKRRFTYSEVMTMTNNFERILGKGGFGVVYHGYLNDAEQVAIKMISQASTQGHKEFKTEVELLLRVHHINLVSLVGYCDERDHLALIYEFMPNGDLKQHLSGRHGGFVLSWASRIRIAVDAALGLEYLHTGCKPPIIHRDVKSTNILLDEHFHAKLADFGLSRSFPVGNETHVSTIVAGTPGYLDPEYYQSNWLTEKSDVYSFGIVLMEIMTNQHVIDQDREKPYIVEWIGLMLTRGDIKNIMDPNLREDYDNDSVWKAVELAMSCVNPSSTGRPNMSRVVQELKECLKSENMRTGGSQGMDSKSSVEVSMNFTSTMIPKPR